MGTVVAYEFCYRYTLTSGSPDDVVSIVVLESVGGDYRVAWTANEREDRNCMTDTVPGFSVMRCCGRTELNPAEMFSVSTNHAYGFVTPTITQNLLFDLEITDAGFQLSIPSSLSSSLPSDGTILTPVDLGISNMQSQTLRQRSVQFIIREYQLLLN